MLALLFALLAADTPPSLSAKLKPPPEAILRPAGPPASKPDSRPTPLQAGIHVEVGKSMKKGKWTKLPDGRQVWRLALRSPGAKAMRVHFDRFAGVAGTVWVHDGIQAAGSYTGDGPNSDKSFWSHPVLGELTVVEFLPTTGKALPFVIDRISHQSIE